MSTEMTTTGGGSVTRKNRQRFDAEQVNLIRDTVAKGASLPQLHLFLELAARYELDPFTGQIWCANMGGQNGGSGAMVIMVGRDGFLAIANRNPEFEGMDGDVVRANDDFKVEMVKGERVVTHNYTTTTDTVASFEGDGHVMADDGRGPILGAWAMVYRQGRKPTYFFARMEEYLPKSQNKREKSPWGAQESAMILKCAESTALRKAFNITGLVGAEEAARQLASGEPEPEALNLDSVPEEARERVADLIFEANELRPGSYRPARVKLMFAGKSPEEVEKLILDLSAFVANARVEDEPDEVLEGTAIEA